MAHEGEAVTMSDGCTHGGDSDALHREVDGWARGWARKLFDEAPPLSGDGTAHFRHVNTRLNGDEVMATRPERFRGCMYAARWYVDHFLLDIYIDLGPPTP